ncbi:MAG: PDZ domain-containing protein [Planctomycetota bacterium]|nr:PDZ domain-containing protein [Planctomycetota bacterium]
MTRRVAAFPILLLLVLLIPAASVRAEDGGEDGVRKAVALARNTVYPALVNISVVAKQFTQGRIVRAPAAGSGVIVSPSGLVVTNHHVAGETTRITCKLPSGEAIDADIVCGDPLTDLCILQLRMGERANTQDPLPFATLGNSDALEIGDVVLAMGNPQSLSSSVTKGIVSNTSRVFMSFTGDSIANLELGAGQQTGIFNQWIQHDALILPGNSGGPLVNLKAQIVGINTRGGGGMSFAIPSNTVKKVLSHAVTYGEVRRGWIGVSAMPVGKMGRKGGVLIASVMPGSPADKAGLKPGDVVTSINDKETTAVGFEGIPLFYAQIADLARDKKANFTYERGNEVHTASVHVAPMENTIGEEQVYGIWGVSAMNITKPMAFRRGYPDTKGIMLSTIRPGSAPDSAKPALQGGDVILAIAGEAVDTHADFERLMKKHKRSKSLTVQFRRGKRDMITVLDMSKKPRRRGSAELAKAWLGVQTQVLTTKVAKAVGLEGQKGFRVTWVLPGTEAEKAGLKSGDVITALNGDELKASEPQDARMLRERIEDLDIGGDAKLSVLRDGKSMDLAVTLEETPSTAADAKKATDELLEYSVREMTYMDKVNRELAMEYEGIVVSDVTLGGWANVAGLRGGDVLLRIQDKEVKSVRAFKKLVKQLASEQPKRIRLFVMRGRSTAFVFVQPDWPRD